MSAPVDSILTALLRGTGLARCTSAGREETRFGRAADDGRLVAPDFGERFGHALIDLLHGRDFGPRAACCALLSIVR
jgi:hypothetical protein